MVNVFGWKRNFRKIDSNNLRKIRQKATVLPTPSNEVISKLKARTPLSLQNISNNLENNNNNSNTPSKPLVRPDSAPDLHKTPGGAMGRKASSLRNLQDAMNPRPTTAPNVMTFLTEDPRDLYSAGITPSSSSRKEIVALCRQRRSSSVSAMLTARKMLFSDTASAKPGSVVLEDGEDIAETEPQTANNINHIENNNNNNNDNENNNNTDDDHNNNTNNKNHSHHQKQKRRKKRFEHIIEV